MDAPMIDSGDTAFMILCTGLVLLMTLPGLAMYYSGMVRTQNVLATIAQSFGIVNLITILWCLVGYSIALCPASPRARPPSVVGDLSNALLLSLTPASVHQLAPTIPESVYCAYQLTFAITTAALICGSLADRLRFGPMLLFMLLWHILVYCPIAYSNWHPNGFLFQAGVLDFAGGNTVHVNSGVAGLVSTIVVGNRHGLGRDAFEPHNVLITYMGACLLWVGWFGFNAGSAVSAGFRAGSALLNTQIATSFGSFSWMMVDWHIRKRPSVLGMLSGAVSGLVAITPACGYVQTSGALAIGVLSGIGCYFGTKLKHRLGYDDALDAFGVHAIGGAIGGTAVGFFATDSVGKVNGFFYGDDGTQIGIQLYGIAVSAGWSACMSFVLLKAIDMTIGLRVSEAEERAGLDSSLHGETICTNNNASSA